MKSFLPWAYCASWIFAPMEVPLLPIWFAITDSWLDFNYLTRLIISTENSIDNSRSLDSAIIAPRLRIYYSIILIVCKEWCCGKPQWCYGFAIVMHCSRRLQSDVMFAHFAVRRNITHAVNITAEGNITCPQGQTSFQNKKHFLRSAFCFGGATRNRTGE